MRNGTSTAKIRLKRSPTAGKTKKRWKQDVGGWSRLHHSKNPLLRKSDRLLDVTIVSMVCMLEPVVPVQRLPQLALCSGSP